MHKSCSLDSELDSGSDHGSCHGAASAGAEGGRGVHHDHNLKGHQMLFFQLPVVGYYWPAMPNAQVLFMVAPSQAGVYLPMQPGI